MTSTIIALADAVVAELQSPEFQPSLAGPYSVERVYLPDLELPDLAVMQVVVLAAERTEEMATRDADQRDFVIEVGVQKKVASTLAAELDPLMEFVDEVIAFLRRRSLANFPDVIPWRIDNSPPYEPELLHERRQFASVIQINYRVIE